MTCPTTLQRNAPAITVDAWREAGLRHPDQKPWARAAPWIFMAAMIVLKLGLGIAARRRQVQ